MRGASSGSLPAFAMEPMCQKEPHQQQRTDQHEQPDRRNGAGRNDDRRTHDEVLRGAEQAVGARLQNADNHEEQSRGRQHRPEEIEFRFGTLHPWIGDPPCQVQDDQHQDCLHAECQPPGGRAGDQPADQWPSRRADPAGGADGAEGSGARLDVIVEDRCQDVDRRDQQRGPDALAQRIAQDQARQRLRDRPRVSAPTP